MRIKSLFSLREYLSLEVSHRLISPDRGDQYLVSFPRSGNTWMRTMLCVLLNPEAEGDPDYTQSRIPGVSLQQISYIRQMARPRIIKSHSWYREKLKRAVYLVRDGRDVLVSLYHYDITRQHKHLPFPAFFDAYQLGKYGQLWHENVESWFDQGRKTLGSDLLIIHFEDLKRDPQHFLGQAARFLGIAADQAEISKAVKLATSSQMREIEVRRRGPVKNVNASFYRGGRTGEWKEFFDARIERAFLNSADRAMELAGSKI